MKRRGTGNREQGTERMEQLLRASVGRVDAAAEPGHDLWPTMLRRMEQKAVVSAWFDWALAGCVAVFAMAFPAAIPVFLYYL